MNPPFENTQTAEATHALNATGSTALPQAASDETEDGKSKVFRITGTNRLIKAKSKAAAAKFASEKVDLREADCNDVIDLYDQANPPQVLVELEGKGKVFVHTQGETKRLVRGNKLSELAKLLTPEIKLEKISPEDLVEALAAGIQVEVAPSAGATRQTQGEAQAAETQAAEAAAPAEANADAPVAEAAA